MGADTERKLIGWDFSDCEINSTHNLVSHQKSALGLETIHVDELERVGEFANDPKRKNRDETNTASLYSCDCKAFNYTGKSLRINKFTPCMHIYRLAFELGILTPVHQKSSKSRYVPLSEEEKATRKARRQAEVEELRQLPRDPSQWGSWNKDLHFAEAQQQRIRRAFDIRDNEPETIEANDPYWIVHGYGCSYEGCDCDDFRYRRLPCKHMYTAAFISEKEVTILEEYI